MVPFWRAVWVQTTAAAEAHLDLEFLLPWVVVIASVVAATASGFATIMVRRTGKGANRAAQQSAEAAQTAAAAAERSSLAAQRSADAAVENAATAAAVARHDQERGMRQELLDRLHWAAELALSPEESRARLGRAHLADLGRIAHQDDTIQRAIDTTLSAVLHPAAEVVATAGEAVIVVRRDVVEESPPHAVPWEADEEEGDP